MDQILIDDLRVMTTIGVLTHEREANQPLRIDLSLGVDLHDAGFSDELDDTVNYGAVCSMVAAVVGESKDVLLERLASRVADACFSFDRVEHVMVRVTKLRPPIPEAVSTTAVEINRTRAELEAPMLHTHEAIIALGSNLGDRQAYLRTAVAELGNVVSASQVFETEPVGGPEGQGAYLNMVVKVHTSLDPFALLRRCQRIEAGAFRQRIVHWGPRTLDVDLLFYDEVSLTSPTLVLPHPQIANRRFVLEPLCEVAPERCPAGWRDSLPPSEIIARGPLS